VKSLRGLLLILVLGGACDGKPWKGITPLHSTRHDVERLIGSPKEPNGNTYESPHERVVISYSRGRCVNGWPYGWDAPFDIVTNISRAPKVAVGLNEIDIDVTGYEQDRNSDTPGWVTYANQREGLSVSFNGIEGKVSMDRLFSPG